MASKSERYVSSRRGWRGGKGSQAKLVKDIAYSIKKHYEMGIYRNITDYTNDPELIELVTAELKRS